MTVDRSKEEHWKDGERPVDASKGRMLTKYQVAERRREVARLYCQGKTQVQIAEELVVSTHVVNNDLRKVKEVWAAGALVDFDEKKQLELAKIDLLEETAWEGYNRSCGVHVEKRVRTEKVPGRSKNKKNRNANNSTSRMRGGVVNFVGVRQVSEAISKNHELVGDVKFLEKISWCIEMRLKILGVLNQKTNVNVVNLGADFWDNLLAHGQDNTVEDRIANALEVTPISVESTECDV